MRAPSYRRKLPFRFMPNRKDVTTVVRYVAYILLCASAFVGAAENGLMLRGSFGMTLPLAPDYLTTYWQPGLEVSAGIGFELENIAFFISFGHQSFDYDEKKYVTSGDHASANELNVYMRKSIKTLPFRTIQPFYSLGVGLALLSTPAMYKTTENMFRSLERGDFLERPHSDSGLNTEIGLGINYKIETQTEFFLELLSRTAFLREQTFATICGRVGVSFGI